MTTKPTTVPARVTWFRMFWMIITQDAALGPYLKLWRGQNPFTNLNLVKISVLAVVVGLVMYFLAESFGGKENSYIVKIIGGVISLCGIIIGFANARCLVRTTTSFTTIWNSGKIELLSRGECDQTMIRAIMSPRAVGLAGLILNLETRGLDRLPRGRREKNIHKTDIDRYVNACIKMGLGKGVIRHGEFVKIIFLIAQGKY